MRTPDRGALATAVMALHAAVDGAPLVPVRAHLLTDGPVVR